MKKILQALLLFMSKLFNSKQLVPDIHPEPVAWEKPKRKKKGLLLIRPTIANCKKIYRNRHGLHVIVFCFLLFSCKSIHNLNCYSRKTVPVTFITKSGYAYTINVPYCDTVKLTTDKMPDSAKAMIKSY